MPTAACAHCTAVLPTDMPKSSRTTSMSLISVPGGGAGPPQLAATRPFFAADAPALRLLAAEAASPVGAPRVGLFRKSANR